jgi:hypothetical protein
MKGRMDWRMGGLVGALVAAVSVSLAACFLGYDSNWAVQKAAQQHNAARASPSAIAAVGDDTHAAAPKRTLRIRFRPNARYLSQTIDATRQLDDLVEDANRVLEGTIGLHLEVQKTESWTYASEESVENALQALAKDDAAQDVDVVVGLIGALPRPTDSLHEVGMAEMLGKHVVLRAASRLGEYDSVDRAFADLSADERDRVVRARRRHRALAVFLHELGHVLGALHEVEVTSLMRPAYDPKMNAFGDDAVILMRLALDEGDRAAVVRAQLDYLKNSKTKSWLPGERDAAIGRLEAAGQSITAESAPSSASAPTPAAPAPAAAASAAAPSALNASDRDRYGQAVAMLRAGSVAAAYETAKPLFAAYPGVLEVQDLRCQLATVRWLEKDEMLKECAGAVRLLDGGAGGGGGKR